MKIFSGVKKIATKIYDKTHTTLAVKNPQEHLSTQETKPIKAIYYKSQALACLNKEKLYERKLSKKAKEEIETLLLKNLISPNCPTKEIQRIANIIETEGQAQVAQALIKNGKYNPFAISKIVYECGENKNYETIIDLVQNAPIKLNEDSFKLLDGIKKTSQEKYEKIKNSTNLLEYANESALSKFNKNNINLLETNNLSEFENMEKILDFIKTKSSKAKPKALLDLYYQNQESFNHAMNSPILLEQFFSQVGVDSCVECLDVKTLKEIEKGYAFDTKTNPLIRHYVKDSDDTKNKKELSEYLSQFKLEDDIHVQRADKTAGLFDQIKLDDTPLEKKIKKLLHTKESKIKKESITPNTGKHAEYHSINLFEYLENKKHYTLSDAMLLAKYGDEKFIEEILNLIKNNSFEDNRFKSTSLSKYFINSWAKNQYDNTNGLKIHSDLILKKGCQGIYDSGDTGQFEFILNNNKKSINYQNAKYDKENNLFILEGTIEA